MSSAATNPIITCRPEDSIDYGEHQGSSPTLCRRGPAPLCSATGSRLTVRIRSKGPSGDSRIMVCIRGPVPTCSARLIVMHSGAAGPLFCRTRFCGVIATLMRVEAGGPRDSVQRDYMQITHHLLLTSLLSPSHSAGTTRDAQSDRSPRHAPP